MFAATLFAAAAYGAGAAQAASFPQDGGTNFMAPATRIMEDTVSFHNFLLPIIVVVSVFVLVLLLWVMIRYNRRANPTPRKFTHNIMVEVIWTVVPVLILVVIAWRSFPLIYAQERIPSDAEITLKVTGNSWNWTYEYPDMGVQITSVMLSEEEAAAAGRPRLLGTTEPLVVPVDTTVRVLVTSNDVIHSFAVPAFGIKEDAIQGRVNETWFRVESSMINGQEYFYGQCSELCGKDHAFMPIEIRVVSRPEFDQWVAAQGGAVASAEPAAPAEAAPSEPAPTEGAAAPTRTR
ncbi:cytochrome c oxidase polypeptide II [alpha proteobacterium U9-1i]|nr:cytochrome c oxidase polypeptide II [alpha proteobacterium U9-1i]